MTMLYSVQYRRQVLCMRLVYGGKGLKTVSGKLIPIASISSLYSFHTVVKFSFNFSSTVIVIRGSVLIEILLL